MSSLKPIQSKQQRQENGGMVMITTVGSFSLSQKEVDWLNEMLSDHAIAEHLQSNYHPEAFEVYSHFTNILQGEGPEQ